MTATALTQRGYNDGGCDETAYHKRDAPGLGETGRMKLVAGVGFEPTTFRL